MYLAFAGGGCDGRVKDSSSLRLATKAFLRVDSEECVVGGNKQNHESRAVERQTLAITWGRSI